MKTPEHILVTGGGGFLGFEIVRHLKERGDRVTSLSRHRYPELENLGVHQIQADLNDAKILKSACSGKDVVFHVAAKAGVWGAHEAYYRANVLGTRHVIEGCREANVSRLVYTSSPSVIFDGRNMEGVDESVPYPKKFHTPYPATKAQAEQEVIDAGKQDLHTISLRPHLIWGPRDNHLVPRIIARANQLRRIGAGHNRVDTIYVENAAEAHIQAADRLKERPELSGRVYFISQDEPIPVWEMVDRILEAGGKSPVQGSVPYPAAWIVGSVLETIYRVFRLKGEPRMTRFVARELSTSHWFDISAAKRDLGYSPTVSTEEGLKRLAQWLRSNT